MTITRCDKDERTGTPSEAILKPRNHDTARIQWMTVKLLVKRTGEAQGGDTNLPGPQGQSQAGLLLSYPQPTGLSPAEIALEAQGIRLPSTEQGQDC